MIQQRVWKQAGVTALLILGLGSSTVVPLLETAPASAKEDRYEDDRAKDDKYDDDRDRRARDDRYRGGRLESGTRIPAAYDDDKNTKRIILKQDETLELELVTTRDVRSDRGDVLIPEGSKIKGRFEPSGDGTRYVAEHLILRDGDRYDIDATSDRITRTETVRRGSNSDRIWQGAIIGGAASAVLAEIFGDIDLIEVLGGAGAGALGGLILGREERKSTEVIIVDPDSDLDLTLERDLDLRD